GGVPVSGVRISSAMGCSVKKGGREVRFFGLLINNNFILCKTTVRQERKPVKKVVLAKRSGTGSLPRRAGCTESLGQGSTNMTITPFLTLKLRGKRDALFARQRARRVANLLCYDV